MSIVEKVSSRHIESMTQRTSEALMDFLSRVSRDAGIAKHVYVVGGAVRNFVLGVPIKDIDVVIDSVRAGKDSEWFAKRVQGEIPVKSTLATNQYGVAILTVKEDWMFAGENLKGEAIEIANARTESYGGAEGKGYKPHMVEPSTIEEDVRRRELTFNTLLWRMSELASGPEKAEILDLTGCGQSDLKDGIMRCPSDPNKTFADDPSRIIRVIKFFVRYGFRMDSQTEKALRLNAKKIRNIPPAHLGTMLLDFVLKEKTAKKALNEMDRLGILDHIKDAVEDSKPLRNALANHANRSSVHHMFLLMDFNLPSGKSLGYLSSKELSRVRDITVQMDADRGTTYIKRLTQPKMDNRAIMEEFGITGRGLGRVRELARASMLRTPALAFDSEKLTDSVRLKLQ